MALHVQVYYGAWRELEVAVKVMSADITRQVAAGLEVSHQLSIYFERSICSALQLRVCSPSPGMPPAIYAVPA